MGLGNYESLRAAQQASLGTMQAGIGYTQIAKKPTLKRFRELESISHALVGFLRERGVTHGEGCYIKAISERYWDLDDLVKEK
jgi:hypothetical protein